MRFLQIARLPHGPFNDAVRDGTAGAKLEKIISTIKPEAVYYSALGGHRTALLIVDLPDASKMPALAEPWFLTFNADVEFHAVMIPADLNAAGLDKISQKWG